MAVEFVGNYADWIKQDWIDFMLSDVGEPGPCKKPPENPHEDAQQNTAIQSGYDLTTTYWHSFPPEKLPFDILLPLDNISIWWFVKMNPGQFMPMHIDQEDKISEQVNRYWMPLQDYESGHVFIIDDILIKDYKKGDMFKFNNPNGLHGACNIGFTPRLVLNCTQNR